MAEIFIRAENLDQLIAYLSEQRQENIAERESKEVYFSSGRLLPAVFCTIVAINLSYLGWLAYSHFASKQQLKPESAVVQVDTTRSPDRTEKRTLYSIIKPVVSEAKKYLSNEDRLEIIRILGAKYGIVQTPSDFYGVSFEILNPKKASAEEKKAYEQVKQEYSKSYLKAPPTLADLLNMVVVRTGNILNDDHAVKEIVNGFFLRNYGVEVTLNEIDVMRNPDGSLKDIRYVPAAQRLKEILVSKPRHVLWLVGQKVPVPLEYMQPR